MTSFWEGNFKKIADLPILNLTRLHQNWHKLESDMALNCNRGVLDCIYCLQQICLNGSKKISLLHRKKLATCLQFLWFLFACQFISSKI
jgi:hypothetical protein